VTSIYPRPVRLALHWTCTGAKLPLKPRCARDCVGGNADQHQRARDLYDSCSLLAQYPVAHNRRKPSAATLADNAPGIEAFGDIREGAPASRCSRIGFALYGGMQASENVPLEEMQALVCRLLIALLGKPGCSYVKTAVNTEACAIALEYPKQPCCTRMP
jgi:hypothetical protein